MIELNTQQLEAVKKGAKLRLRLFGQKIVFDAFDSHEFTVFFGDDLLGFDASGTQSFGNVGRKVVI